MNYKQKKASHFEKANIAESMIKEVAKDVQKNSKLKKQKILSRLQYIS